MGSRRTPGPRLLLAGVTAVLLLAGCAQQGGARAGGGAGGTPTTSTAPPSSTAPARSQPVPGNNLVVRGTVRAGVEPGCLLLDAQDKQAYLLLDGDLSMLRPGARVEVVGQRTDQIVSTCNEGVVLSVVSVRPLG